MKTAEELVATLQISDLQLTVEIINLMREVYGAQVREEAAKIAEPKYCKDARLAELLGLVANQIRDMELP